MLSVKGLWNWMMVPKNTERFERFQERIVRVILFVLLLISAPNIIITPLIYDSYVWEFVGASALVTVITLGLMWLVNKGYLQSILYIVLIVEYVGFILVMLGEWYPDVSFVSNVSVFLMVTATIAISRPRNIVIFGLLTTVSVFVVAIMYFESAQDIRGLIVKPPIEVLGFQVIPLLAYLLMAMFKEASNNAREAERIATVKANEAKEKIKLLFLQIQFLGSSVSHDIRPSVSNLRSFIQTLELDEDDADIVFELLNNLYRSVDDLVGILKDLDTEIQYKFKESDVARIIRNQAKISGESISLEVSYVGPETLPVITDSRVIENILANLVNNAIKFTDNGSIIISLIEKDETFSFSVKDTGRGFTASQAETIFQYGTQLEESDAQVGFGLGLSSIESLIEQMNGTIYAQSDGPGRGATFTVELPRKEVEK